MRCRYTLLTIAVLAATPAYSDWFDNAVQRAIERTGTRAVDEGADAAYSGAKNSAKEAGAKKTTSDNAQASDSGSRSNVASAGSGAGAGDSGSGEVQNEAAYNKFDFVPGDKVIFFDDFSDTDIGEFPRKWTLNGPRGGGDPAEVVKYAGQNYLSTSGYTWLYLRLNQKGDMPEKFTIECDVIFTDSRNNRENYTRYEFLMPTADNNNARFSIGAIEAKSEFNKMALGFRDKQDKKIHHFSISVNGTFLKAYVDNVRVLNDPDAIQRPIKQIGVGPWSSTGPAMFSNFRLAEGGKNIKSAIDTDGKIVTHGILFDLGSDKIRPESAATLNSILAILNDDAGLKFSIEGHTDNQGSVATNQPLSEKRAAAVKNWLVSKGIDAGRLQTKGWGQSKPIDSTSTKEGQANNRRVEFIKI